MTMKNEQLKDWKAIPQKLKAALQENEAMGAGANPILLLAVTPIKAKPGEQEGSVEIVVLHDDTVKAFRTVLDKNTPGDAKLVPGEKEIVILTLPDKTLTICVPYWGNYFYF